MSRLGVSLIDRLPLSRTARGTLLVLLSTAAIASIFVIGKAFLNSLDAATFSLWYYTATVVVAVVYQRVRGRPGLWTTLRAHRPGPIALLGLMSGLSTIFFFAAIRRLDPAVASFFDRSETLFAVLLGLLLFGERFTRLEVAGVALLAVGVIFLTYRAGQVIVEGALLVFAANLLYALGLALVKGRLARVEVGALTGLRALFAWPILAGYALFTAGWRLPALGQAAGLLLAAFLGPFLGHMLYYRALRYIDLSKASLLHSTQPAFVAVLGLVAFGTFPDARQWLGGVLVLAGVYLLLAGRPRPAAEPEVLGEAVP
jgi:drug/metabolite transporter (DMT)-like permease